MLHHSSLITRLAGALLAIWLILGAPTQHSALSTQHSPTAWAQQTGVITGRVVNGTSEGAVPAGAEVVLYTFRGRDQQARQPVPADEQGAFRFEGLDLGEDVTYYVTATHGGITYNTEPVRLTAAQPEQSVELRIYETTNTDPGLRASRVALILSSFDRDQQLIAASELVNLVNPTDRTFAPSPDGSAGPMGFVRFGLPPGARDLRPSLGLGPTQVIQIDRGFASTAPVLPGEHEYGYVYRLPYTDETLALEKSFPYGAEVFQIVTPESGPTVVGPGITPGESVEIGATRYRIWAARNIAPGTRLALELRGLPAPPIWRTALAAVTRPAVIPAALAAVLLLGTVWALRRRARPQPAVAGLPPAFSEEASATADALLVALADLDDAFADGRLAEPEYRERRAALKSRLRTVIQAEGKLPTGLPAGNSKPSTRPTIPGPRTEIARFEP